jgi:tight adherence protein C
MELAAAIVAGLAIVLVVYALAPQPASAVRARLDQIGNLQAVGLEELELEKPFFERTVRPIAQRLAGLGQRLTSERTVSRTAERLAAAGNPGNMRTGDFAGLKILLAAGLGVGGFLLFLILSRSPLVAVFLGVVMALLGYILPEFWLGRRIAGRRRQMLRSMPDTLDLLTISVRAGLAFDSALAKVVEKTTGPLADEFRRALAEVRVGKVRRDALRDMATRTQVPSVNSFIAAIIQADQLGVPISRVLQVQSEQLRIERRQRAEEMANKAPIKMLIPLVGCIFPSMFIVILGPAIISIIINVVMRQQQ